MPKGYPVNGRHTRRSAKNLARGSKQGYMMKGWFAIDPETFEEVRALALRNDVSFSEMLRTLIEWGLETRVDG